MSVVHYIFNLSAVQRCGAKGDTPSAAALLHAHTGHLKRASSACRMPDGRRESRKNGGEKRQHQEK